MGVFTGEKNIRCDTIGVLLFSFLHTALTIKQILQACSRVCVCIITKIKPYKIFLIKFNNELL